MKEIWKDIKGYEGYYQVSNIGRVRSLDRTVIHKFNNKFYKGIILKQSCVPYLRVHLSVKNKKETPTVHRLVAITFIDNLENKPCVNHIDGNKLNNSMENLEWVTCKENSVHAKVNNLLSVKPVIMLSKDNKHLLKFSSIEEASNITGYNKGHICNCCSGVRKTHGGYKWEYLKKDLEI